MEKNKFQTIDEYLDTLPMESRIILERIRELINSLVPDAMEVISYQIPAFKLNGRMLIYFAAWKNHVSLYPIPLGDEVFKKAIAPYVKGRGTIQFPLDKPILIRLVKKIVTKSVKTNIGKYGKN